MSAPGSLPTRLRFLEPLIPEVLWRRLSDRRDVLMLMSLTFAAKPFGFVVQLLIASSFGARSETDAYFVGLFLATVVANVGVQIFTTLVIPLYFDRTTPGDEQGVNRFLNAVLVLFTAPLVLVALALLAAPRWAIAIAAPGFEGGALAVTERMTRLMAAGTILTGVGGYLSALLNVRRVFWLPGVLPILQAVVTIATILATRKSLGPFCLAVSFLLSAAIAVGVQGVAALRLGLMRGLAPSWRDPHLSRLVNLVGPVLLSALIVQGLFMVDKVMASHLDAGSVSALSYASTVNMLTLQLFAGTFVTVLFTDLAALISRGDTAGFRAAFQRDTRYLMACIVPFATLALVLNEEIVGVLYGHGVFDQTAMKVTSKALMMYSIGLPMIGMNMLIARVFHSLKAMTARMLIDVAWLATNVGVNLLLIRPLGVAGLALGTSAAAAVNVVLAMIYLRRRHGGVGEGAVARAFGESLIAGGVMAVVIAAIPAEFVGDWSASRLHRALGIGAIGVAGLVAYAATLVAIRLASRRRQPA
jgi:putative peptidoglycan lipid II flippase